MTGANTSLVEPRVGLNTLLLTASSTVVPDIVALAATPSHDGMVALAGANGAGAFSVATVNVGGGSQITAFADTGGVILPLSLAVCQTNPASGACLGPPDNAVTTQINPGATPTFAVFVTGQGPVPFDPAVNRIFVRFVDGGGVVRGATSVGVRTE